MKNFIYLLLGIAVIFTSCNKDEDSILNNKLTNDEDETTSEIVSRSVQTSSKGFEGSIPVWQYYIYRNSQSADHYFTSTDSDRPRPEVNGTPKVIKGSTYNYAYSDFNVMYTNHANTKPLYRYYSPSGRIHRLSTSTLKSDSHYNDYVYDGILGYIYTYQHTGTIPLRERYVIPQRGYNYVSLDRAIAWEQQYMPGQIQDLGIIGYVYPGKRSEDEEKVPNVINVLCEDPTYERILRNQPIVTIKITVREQIKPTGTAYYRTLTYNELYHENIQFELAGAYTIHKIEATIKIKDKNKIQRTEKFDLYPNNNQQWYTGQYVTFWVTTIMTPSKGILSYHITPINGYNM